MELGMIGLGKMGANMTERLIKGGHRVVGFDLDPESVQRVWLFWFEKESGRRTCSAC